MKCVAYDYVTILIHMNSVHLFLFYFFRSILYYIPSYVFSSKLPTIFGFPHRNSVCAEEIRVIVSFGTVIRDASVSNILITAFSDSAARVSSPFQTKYRQTDDNDYHTNR